MKSRRRKSKVVSRAESHDSFQVRWQNFRSLADTSWIDIRPLTVVIGPNGSGKTSFLAPLLILKQTLQTSDRSLALNTRGALFNAGAYRDFAPNRDCSREVVFGIRFHHHGNPPVALKSPPSYPPGEIELAFGQGSSEHWPVLTRYSVRDIYGQEMLTRHRHEEKYDISGLDLSKSERNIASAIQNALPVRFLFGTDAVFRAYFEGHVKAKKKDQHDSAPVKFDDATSVYMEIVSRVAATIEVLLNRISFIGPLRHHPQRIYEVSGEHPAGVGTSGQFAPELLFRNRDNVLQRVNQWLEKFEFGVKVSCSKRGDEAFSVDLEKRNTGTTLNLADDGFGLSQVLPLIVQCVTAKPDDILIAEQPEIHLNPKLQAVLADLLVDAVDRKTTVIIETHSEHMLLRLRRLVAEGKADAANMALLYAERSETGSHLRSIPIAKTGHIDGQQWPRGFFEDSLKEALALAQAQSNRRAD